MQITGDALAALMIFLILAEFLPLSASVVTGMLAAFSPQLAWNTVLLLPDSLAVLPILGAIYFLARAVRRPRLWIFVITGMLAGLSCWLRANAIFLTFFIALAVMLLVKAERRWRFALAVVCGTLLIVLPLTIRNAIVFHRFIPLSLGAGQTLLEGIADYDSQSRFGIQNTDVGIMKQEAEQSHRPEYFGTLFKPDGVERERARLARGFAVIRAHPFWFSGVMARRAASMLRLERSRLVSTEPAISHPPVPTASPYLVLYPADLQKDALTTSARIRAEDVGVTSGILRIADGNPGYGVLAAWEVSVQPNTDYLLETVVKVESGRMRISVVSDNNKILSSTVLDAVENTMAEEQPDAVVRLTFVADKAHLRIVLSNEASPGPMLKMGTVTLSNLGPARFLWSRYPRLIVHGIQSLFLTAVILPLALIGLGLLTWQGRRTAIIILLVVPIYFFLVQSIVHTEYRYVLAVDYFLFALAGVTFSWAIGLAQASYLKLGRPVRTER